MSGNDQLIMWYLLTAFICLLSVCVVLSQVHLQQKNVRLSFQSLCMSVLMYTSFLSYFWLEASPKTDIIALRGVFISANIALICFAVFVRIFIAVNTGINFLFRFYILFLSISVLLSFTDLIGSGVTRIADIKSVNYGLLYPIWAVATGLFLLFISIGLIHTLIITKDILTKVQLRVIGFCIIISAFLIGLNNILIPAVWGNSEYVKFSVVWLSPVFIGSLFVLKRGPEIAVAYQFRVSLEHLNIRENYMQLTRFLQGWTFWISTGEPLTFRASIKFRDESFQTLTFRGEPADKLLSDESSDDQLYLSLIKQQAETRKMAKLLIQISEEPATSPEIRTKIEEIPEPQPGPLGGFWILDFYLPQMEKEVEENQKIFNREILCFSNRFYHCLTQALIYGRSGESVLIEGEPGSGRELLFHAMNYLLTGGKSYEEINCSTRILDDFTRAWRTDQKVILIKNLKASSSFDFDRLYEMKKAGKVIFATVTPGHAKRLFRDQVQKFTRVFRWKITVPPLRKRKNEIPLLVLWILRKLRSEGVNVPDRISVSDMETFTNSRLKGNFVELEEMVRSAFQEMDIVGNRLEPPSDLTPLEIAERKVILEHMDRNNYNRKKTAGDLGITSNTLRSKLKKYGI